jgi:hypothetical protein
LQLHLPFKKLNFSQLGCPNRVTGYLLSSVYNERKPLKMFLWLQPPQKHSGELGFAQVFYQWFKLPLTTVSCITCTCFLAKAVYSGFKKVNVARSHRCSPILGQTPF